LLEEAFHALRVSPLSNLAIYYVGCVPFVISLFYFLADMSRSSFALQDAAFASLLVSGAYFWMKVWQTVFCRKMWKHLNAGGESIERSRGMSLRYLATQVMIQSTAIPVLVLALICMVPLAWVYAFYQNVSALGLTQDYGYRPLRHLVVDAARQSHWAWGNNHLLMMVLAVFSLFVWMSVMMMAVFLPILARMLLGVESVFTMNPFATYLNSTFIFGTVLIVFLCVSPLTKTLYVIRCFYGQSRTTGADLLSRLAVLKSGWEQSQPVRGSRRGSLGKVVLLFFIIGLPSNGVAEADGSDVGAGAKRHRNEVEIAEGKQTIERSDIGGPKGQAKRPKSIHQVADTVSAEEFDAAVQDTLQEKHFQWRLPREHVTGEEEGGAQGFVRDLMKSLVSIVKEGFGMAETLLERLFGGKQKKRDVGGLEGWGELGKVASVLTVVLLVILLVVVVKMIVSRRKQMGVQGVEAVSVGPIDLESEAVVATQLPEDEWMRMAREKIEKGEYRLAVRALFLASLAHLGEHGLLKIARFKSNQDYRGELSLKARSMPAVIEAFSENIGLFEWVWYGLHDIGSDAVERFTRNYEQITSATLQVRKEGHAS